MTCIMTLEETEFFNLLDGYARKNAPLSAPTAVTIQ
jgi:hypothetical protein